MLEGHEKQFAVSALNRSGTKSGSNERSQKQHAKSSERQAASTTSRTTEKSTEVGVPSQIWCYKCKQVGHVRRDCPVRRDTGRNSTTGAADKHEAPGRTTQVNTNVVEATSLPARLEDLTETQLEQLLATKRLGRESAELPAVSQTNVVSVSEEKAGTIGTLLHVEVLI